MFSKKFTIVLCVFVAVMFVAAMASADDRSSTIQRKFQNNQGTAQTDLHIYFNESVDAATGVTGYNPPFSDITNNGPNVIELTNGNVPVDGWTGCMGFSSSGPGLKIDSVKWTPSDSLLEVGNIVPCGVVPSLTTYGLIALAILIALTGLWMYRRKRATA